MQKRTDLPPPALKRRNLFMLETTVSKRKRNVSYHKPTNYSWIKMKEDFRPSQYVTNNHQKVSYLEIWKSLLKQFLYNRITLWNWKKCRIRLGRIFSHIFMPNMSFSPVCRGYFFDWQKIWATWHAAWHTIVKVIVKQADSKIWVVCSSSYAFSSTWQLSGKAKWKFISP